MGATATIELSQMTGDQIMAEFEAKTAELAELNTVVEAEGATAERNAAKTELGEQITELRAAWDDVQPTPEIDTTPLVVAETPEEEDPAPVEDPADDPAEDPVEDPADDPVEDLTDEQLAEAAKRAHSKTETPPSETPAPVTQRASIRRASRTADGTSNTYGAKFESMNDLAAHFKRARKKSSPTGAVVGFQRFDRAAAETSGMIITPGMSESQIMDVFSRATGQCTDHGVRRATCGCADETSTPINDVPYIFCPMGNEINDWFRTVPFDDGCKIGINLPRKRTPYDVGEWGYCVPTGQVDADGEPIFATGKIVRDAAGVATVPVPWDPNKPTTWKDTQRLNLECAKQYFALQAQYVAIDIARAERLCRGADVARELQFISADIGAGNAQRSINALSAYANAFGYQYDGDGTGALNFGDGLVSLIADEFEAIERDECLDLSEYDVFVMNANEKWMSQDTARSLRADGGQTPLEILDECFNDVIFTKVLPTDVAATAQYTGTPGASTTLNPADCDRTVTLIAAHRDKWVRGIGEDINVSIDRGDKSTVLGNAELWFTETEHTDIPLNNVSALRMDFDLNNKGMLAGVAEPCA